MACKISKTKHVQCLLCSQQCNKMKNKLCQTVETIAKKKIKKQSILKQRSVITVICNIS